MALKTKYNTSFIVMPTMCNFRFPQIFGGAFMAKLDLCAAATCSQLLQFSNSPCDNAVTYKVLDLTFFKSASLGDLIFLEGTVVELRNNSITVNVKAYKQDRLQKYPEPILCAEATFVFVTLKDSNYTSHGLKLNDF